MSTVKSITGLSALFAFLFGVGLIHAAEEKPKPSQPHVVIIGVGEFKDPLVTPRKFAEDDAKALYDLLTSKDHLGVDKDHIKLLLGKKDEKRGSEEATRENVLNAVKWLVKSAK